MNPDEGLDEAEALAALLVEESTIVPDAAPAATTVTLPAGFTITPELLAQGQAFASQFLGGTAANTNALQALVERLAPSSTPLTPAQNEERIANLTKEFFTDPEAVLKKFTSSAAPVANVDSALDPIYQQNGSRTIKDFTKEKAALFAKPAIYDAVKKEFDAILKENVSEGKPAAYHIGRMGDEQSTKVLSQLWRTAYGTVGESQLIGRIAKVAQTTGSGSGLGSSSATSGIQKFAETAARAAATQQDGKVDQAKYKEYLSAALEGLE